MKRLLLISLLFLAAACCGEKAPKMKASHVIFIGVDGVSTPAFKDPALLARMPNVKMMMEQGAYTLGKRSVMPSASAINWATIFNGLPTEQHGYYHWNSSKPEIPAVLDNGRGMPPTIYTLLREQRPEAETGCVYNWDGIGPLLDTTVLDYHLYDPGYHNPDGYTMDKYTQERAVKYILEKKPTFFTFYIGDVDEVGHRCGWDTPEYYDCLEETDRSVGFILQAAKDAGIFDDTIFVFSSDHGGSGKGHGQLQMLHLETPFVLYGKNIRKGYVLDFPMMQYDLPATLAYALGVQIPKQWRGRPMTEMFQ
jgi:predicted AlkP superfamily pyrophosphatase or phosphodiesterase